MQARPGRSTALLVAAAFFMENLDGTIIATAAPAIGRSLRVDAIDVNVVATAYLLTVAVLIPVSGWLADRYGARRVFASAIVLFTLASLLCALSTSLAELTVLRVLQGAGGALMVPVGRLVVLRVTPKAEVISAIAYLTWPALIAPIVAPLAGGLIVEHASWRWIFFLNVPLGVAALPLALRFIPAVGAPDPGRLDWLGFVLIGGALASLMIGLENAGAAAPSPLVLSVALGLAAGLGLLAVRHLRRGQRGDRRRDRRGTSAPLLDLRVLAIRTFRVAQSGGSVFRVAISAVPFLVPLMLQEGFGWSPATAGLITLTIFIGNLGIKPATTGLIRRLGFRRVLVINGSLTVAVLVAIGLVGPATPIGLIAGVLVLSGVFRSISFTAYNTITFADVPPEQTAAANALASMLFQLTLGMGVAAGALAVRVGQPIGDLLGLAGPVAAYHVAFMLLALLALPAVIESARLPGNAGSSLTQA